MTKAFVLAAAGFLAFTSSGAVSASTRAGVAADQSALLVSLDPQLERNKRLVYDFWRVVLEAGHADRMDEYVAENFIQHNPNMRDGRAFFAELVRRERPVPTEVQPTLSSPLLSIVAERDTVVMLFVVTGQVPDDPSKTYTTTRHDTYRVENGLLAEHWDIEVKGVSRHKESLDSLAGESRR